MAKHELCKGLGPLKSRTLKGTGLAMHIAVSAMRSRRSATLRSEDRMALTVQATGVHEKREQDSRFGAHKKLRTLSPDAARGRLIAPELLIGGKAGAARRVGGDGRRPP